MTVERTEALLRGEPGRDESELRLQEMIGELRSSAPPVPDALRLRVQGLAERPAPARAFRFPLRRFALAAGTACVVAGLGAALVQGIVSSGSGPSRERLSAQGEAAVTEQAGSWDSANVASDAAAKSLERRTLRGFPALPPNRSRLQAYDATLRVRLADTATLSRAANRAMRLARSYGGYVAFVDYDTGGREGRAELRLRIPVTRVQSAIVRLSALGEVVGQGFRVTDLQRTFDRLEDRIARQRGLVARLRGDVRDPSLSAEERIQAQLGLQRAERTLRRLVGDSRQVTSRARLAKVSLSLTTQDAAVAAKQPGRIERAFTDAGSVLAKEVAWALYVLVVALPLLLLAVILVLVARTARRRGERLLLERS